MNQQFLNTYAKILVRVGLNVQKGEQLFINSPVMAADLAREIASEAYAVGAGRVICSFSDQQMDKLRLLNESRESILDIPEWTVMQKNYVPEGQCAYINILADDPDAYSEIDPTLIAERSRLLRTKCKRFHDGAMTNEFKWCLAAYASPAWAKKVFPELDTDAAVQKLWEHIAVAMRMSEGDPVENWLAHQARIAGIKKYLNEMQFDEFRYTNSLGTDLTVGMPKNYRFEGADAKSKYGVTFVANMPTEECFSAPHKYKVDGIVYSALPLARNGRVIEDFYIRFEKGRAVEFGAKKGEDALREIICSDEGSHYLGEIAFVNNHSPISDLKTVFYTTLFDENASCHFALGRAYASCVEGGDGMTPEQCEASGINMSIEHCDFMIGTADLTITAYKNGEAYPIFENGNFVENFKR